MGEKKLVNCKYNKIYVVCPALTKTGGTELLHQLVFQLNHLGANAYIVYYGTTKRNIVNYAFLKYIDTSIIIEDIEDEISNLLVIPEINCTILNTYKNIKTAIWWLSVDNFLEKQAGCIGRIKTRGFCRGVLGSIRRFLNHTLVDNRQIVKKADIHLCQSYYAKDFINSLGINNEIYYLSDYINDVYLNNAYIVSEGAKRNIVLYNPKKGYKFTKKIIGSAPDIDWVPLQNMTTEEVMQTMKDAKVYIDFGNHPGKDRFPREAASCKCCIITGKRGAANFNEDIMIPARFKYDEKNRNIKTIVDCIRDILKNYEKCLKEYESYRQYIIHEKENFVADIEQIFFD